MHRVRRTHNERKYVFSKLQINIFLSLNMNQGRNLISTVKEKIFLTQVVTKFIKNSKWFISLLKTFIQNKMINNVYNLTDNIQGSICHAQACPPNDQE